MGELLRSPDGSINRKVLPLDCQAYLANEMEEAHKAWEEEKEKVLEGLKGIILTDTKQDRIAINRAIQFIEEAHER